MARTALRRDRGLQGKRYAKAGLVIGYSLLGLAIFIVGVAWAVVNLNQRSRAALTILQPSSYRPEPKPPKPQAAPAKIRPVEDQAASLIRPKQASGKVHGQEFHCQEATWQEGVLTMTDGKPWPAGARIKIFLFPNEGESPDGKIYEILPTSVSNVPHVHLSWIEGNLPRKGDFPGGYHLRLELGRMTNGSISGRIVEQNETTVKADIGDGFIAVLM